MHPLGIVFFWEVPYLVKPVSFEGFLGVVRQIASYWLSLNVAPPEGEP
jgi:hypothetical protein